jgi:ribosomal protein S18 acetylase RimI-like enzyme
MDGAMTEAVSIRPARIADIDVVISLDERITGVAKHDYWRDLFERVERRSEARFFLVAEAETGVVGFIIGEVRAWEFGSEPCGWVFAVSVDPKARLGGIGERLLAAIEEKFRGAGVAKIRTMLSHDNQLLMSFFRGEGLRAGPYIQLEKDLD